MDLEDRFQDKSDNLLDKFLIDWAVILGTIATGILIYGAYRFSEKFSEYINYLDWHNYFKL